MAVIIDFSFGEAFILTHVAATSPAVVDGRMKCSMAHRCHELGGSADAVDARGAAYQEMGFPVSFRSHHDRRRAAVAPVPVDRTHNLGTVGDRGGYVNVVEIAEHHG